MKKSKRVSMDELFKCLSYYANKKNYRNKEGWPEFYNIIKDDGLKARRILKRLVKETLDNNDIKNNL